MPWTIWCRNAAKDAAIVVASRQISGINMAFTRLAGRSYSVPGPALLSLTAPLALMAACPR